LALFCRFSAALPVLVAASVRILCYLERRPNVIWIELLVLSIYDVKTKLLLSFNLRPLPANFSSLMIDTISESD